jgi:hypothetical protein
VTAGSKDGLYLVKFRDSEDDYHVEKVVVDISGRGVASIPQGLLKLFPDHRHNNTLNG